MPLTVRSAGGVPKPLRETTDAGFAALCWKVNVPIRFPSADAVIRTEYEQDAPGARATPPQVLDSVLKSDAFAPPKVVLLTTSGAVPAFDRMTVCPGPGWPSSCAPNASVDTEVTAIGRVPVPESVTMCGLVVELSGRVNVALRFPLVSGLKLRPT